MILVAYPRHFCEAMNILARGTENLDNREPTWLVIQILYQLN
ncbi:protein of unknown function [Shewanella benthica]|uniref:Uncharacterized protein n=1 Tax=Shewanella benthica TaxID=43661 RepID=A0A330M581_9GAMM|nr:protein of unknown function [Shewanella benthica]